MEDGCRTYAVGPSLLGLRGPDTEQVRLDNRTTLVKLVRLDNRTTLVKLIWSLFLLLCINPPPTALHAHQQNTNPCRSKGQLSEMFAALAYSACYS